MLELPVLTVERVRDHRPKVHSSVHRTLHQIFGYLQLGAELRILLAALEVVRRCVRLELQWIVHSLVGKQAGYADYPVFCLTDVCKPPPSHMRCMLAPLAVPM